MRLFYWFTPQKVSRTLEGESPPPAAVVMEPLEPRLMLNGSVEPVIPLGMDHFGVSMPSWWITSYETTGPAALTALSETGCNVVGLTPTWYQDTFDSAVIQPSMAKTTNDTGLIQMITQAHQADMTVVLKPHVDVVTGDHRGTWRGYISPTDAGAWFDAYEDFILYYAGIANAQDVEVLVIGTELASLSGAGHQTDWTDLITQIRTVYSGELVYAANHDEYQNVSFWDEVDGVGINAYFDLGPGAPDPGAPYADVLAAWAPFVAEVDAWMTTERPGQTALFTEIGYRSITGSHIEPWDSDRAGTVDPQAQVDNYRAAVDAWQGKDWLIGMIFWAWPVDLAADVGGDELTTGYSPYGKAAETTLADYASRLYLPDLTVTDIDIRNRDVIGGQTVTVDVTTTNAGPGAAAPLGAAEFSTSLFLRNDLLFDPAFVADIVSAEPYTDLDASGGTHTATLTFTAPAGPGRYYVVAMADSDLLVSEGNEDNNWSVIADFYVHRAPEVNQAIGRRDVLTNAPPTVINLAGHFNDPDVTGSVYRFTSNVGAFDVHLFNQATPITVANFRAYADAGDYADMFMHRSMPDFVVQGGGFTFTETEGVQEVRSRGTILNEPGISNLRGTVAMAKMGSDPNSATSQLFVSLADNSANLDYQNGGFTVFGEVLGTGMDVPDAIAELEIWNFGEPFDNLPMIGYEGAAVLQENLVYFSSISQTAPLTFEVIGNTNPALVGTAVGDDGTLTLTYGTDLRGMAEITVRATDLFGATVESSFEVHVHGPDLTVEFTSVDLASALLAGAKGRARLQVNNIGVAAVREKATIEVWAVPDATAAAAGVGEYLLGRLTDKMLNIRAGASSTQNVSLLLPAAMPEADYTLRAAVDTTNRIIEDDETNNTALTGAAYAVRDPFLDLVAGLGAAVLPAQVTSGDGTRIRLPVSVANEGNVPVPAGTKITVEVYARQAGSPDVLVATADGQTVAGIKPGAVKTLNINLQLPPGLAAGNTQLVARIDTTNVVAESDETNNEAVTAGAIAVTRGFVDLAGTFNTVKLPAAVVSDTKLTGTVQINVANQGTVALPTGQKIDVTLIARETTSGAEVVLATTLGQSVSRLKAGAVKRVTIRVLREAGLPAGTYELRADITPQGGLVEESAVNNSVTLTGGGAAVTVNSAAAFVDLTADLGGAALPAQLTSGDGTRIRLPVSVANEGNVPVPGGTKITVEVYARQAGSPDVLVATADGQTVSGLKPGAAKTLNINLQLPPGLAAGNTQLAAVIDTTNAVAESDETNNEAVTAGATAVTRGFVDLAGTFNTVRLPAAATADAKVTGTVQINVANQGTVALPVGQKIDVALVARETTSGVEIVLGNRLGQSVSRLKGGAVKRVTVRVLLEAGLPEGTYELRADIVAQGNLVEESLNNNAVTVDALGAKPTVVSAPAV